MFGNCLERGETQKPVAQWLGKAWEAKACWPGGGEGYLGGAIISYLLHFSLYQDGERGVRFHPRQWADQEKVSADEQDREEHTVSVSGLGRQEMGDQGGMKGPDRRTLQRRTLGPLVALHSLSPSLPPSQTRCG